MIWPTVFHHRFPCCIECQRRLAMRMVSVCQTRELWQNKRNLLTNVDAVLYEVKIVASFYKVQCEHIQWGVMDTKYVFCFKFPEVCFCQKLAKLNDIWLNYHKIKGLRFFSETQCIMCLDLTQPNASLEHICCV